MIPDSNNERNEPASQSPDPIKAVIFDCDGTLVDSEPISQQVLVELFAEQGLRITHQQAMEQWAGRDLHEIFREAESELNRKLPDDFVDVFRSEQLSRLKRDLQPVPGAADVLRSLNKISCVASNAPTVKVRCCLEATGLIEFFDDERLFSAYEVQAWKPKPDVFLHAAAKLNVAPQHCVVIEDSQFGVDAAIAAGMHVYHFEPNQTSANQSVAGVTVIRQLSELIPIFQAN